MARPVVNYGHQKDMCHDETELCAQNLCTILSSTMYAIGRACVIIQRVESLLRWSHITFASLLQFCNVNWHSLQFIAKTNQRRPSPSQFPSQSTSQLCGFGSAFCGNTHCCKRCFFWSILMLKTQLTENVRVWFFHSSPSFISHQIELWKSEQKNVYIPIIHTDLDLGSHPRIDSLLSQW